MTDEARRMALKLERVKAHLMGGREWTREMVLDISEVVAFLTREQEGHLLTDLETLALPMLWPIIVQPPKTPEGLRQRLFELVPRLARGTGLTELECAGVLAGAWTRWEQATARICQDSSPPSACPSFSGSSKPTS